MFIIDDIINAINGAKANDEAKKAIERQQAQTQGLALPQFSNQTYNPQMYANPEAAQGQTISLQPGTREAQMQALQNMQDQSRGLSDATSDLSRFKAVQDANQLASSRDQATLANAQARGVGGGGLEFALRQQGGQAAANRAQDAGLQGAYQAALQRMQAGNNYIQGLGNVRNQDTSLAGQNADIINRFNMYNVGNRNAANQANVQMGNQGQQYNLQRGDQNAMSTFNAGATKQQMSNQLLNPQLQNIGAGAANTANAITGTLGSAANLGLMAAGLGGAFGGGQKQQEDPWAQNKQRQASYY